MGRKDAEIQKGNVERRSLSRLEANPTGWKCSVPAFAQRSTKPRELAHLEPLEPFQVYRHSEAIFYRE
jgi:hypothetical protein